jgi:TonB family protein
MNWKSWEGRTIDGRFRLANYLGGSAHSGVFATEMDGVPKAAIKLIPMDSGSAEAWNLRREFASKLTHPGLLPILAFGASHSDETSIAYAVMEYAEEDLSLVLPSRPLTADETREVILSVADTLGYLHKEGFVHTALKPGNILATGDRVKISSDRLLRIGEPLDLAIESGMPPESATGLTQASDAWLLGRTIVEMLTQSPPGSGPVAVVPRKLPAPFLEIATRCLQTDPRNRCSIADVVRTLDPQPAVSAPKPATKPPAQAQPAQDQPAARRRLPAWSMIVAGGIILTSFVAITSRNSKPEIPAPKADPPVAKEAPTPAPKTGEVLPPAVIEKPKPFPTEPKPAPAVAPDPPQPSASREISSDVVDGVLPTVPQQYLATIRGIVKVGVLVHVNATGSVTDAALGAPRGGRYFDRIALETARKWKFAPGQPDDARHIVRFEFRQSGCTASSSPLSR